MNEGALPHSPDGSFFFYPLPCLVGRLIMESICFRTLVRFGVQNLRLLSKKEVSLLLLVPPAPFLSFLGLSRKRRAFRLFTLTFISPLKYGSPPSLFFRIVTASQSFPQVSPLRILIELTLALSIFLRFHLLGDSNKIPTPL